MSLYILRWNPAISSYKKEDHKDLVMHVKKGEQPAEFNWSVNQWENLKKDDFYILQQVGTENDGIAMIGKFRGPCYEDKSWKNSKKTIHYADMWIMDAFDLDEKNVLPASKYEKLFPEINWHGGHSGEAVDDKTAEKLLAQIKSDMVTALLWEEDIFEKFADFHGQEAKRPTKEMLADGKILLSLKNQYIKENNEDNFVQVVCCLHDSFVFVPMKIEVKDKSKELTAENMTFYPKTLENENGEIAFPMFSTEAEAGNSFADDKDFQLLNISVLKCIEFARNMECSLLVLDGFTNPLVINKELADLIYSLKYKDGE